MTTGNSSFRKMSSNVVTAEGFDVSNGSVGNILVDKLEAGIILPARYGTPKTVIGYTSTSFNNKTGVFQNDTWLNTSRGQLDPPTSTSPQFLNLPTDSVVIAVVATEDGETIAGGGASLTIGTDFTGSTNIFGAGTAVVDLSPPGLKVGAWPTISTLGTSGSKIYNGLTTGPSGVSIRTTGTLTAGNLKVTIYYI
jgi:hypothetical protein